MATIPTLANYNLNPASQSGSGAYGSVPGALGLPPSTYSQVGSVLPSLPTLTDKAGQVVGSELAGELPSGTIGATQDAAAAFGVGAGMPGSGVQANMGAESLGLSALQLQQMGLQNFQSLIPTIGSTMLSPDLINSIAGQNALYGAAPDPASAADVLTKLAGGGTSGLSISGAGPPSPLTGKTVQGNVNVPANPGATTTLNPFSTTTGGYSTPGGASTYANDQWYYAGQTGPGVDTQDVGLPGLGLDDNTAGYDSDYYNFLVGQTGAGAPT